MCDKLNKTNLTGEEIPNYVYKVVQKVGNGKYVTPVMGEPLYKGSWKKAPNIEEPIESDRPLIDIIQTKYNSSIRAVSSKWVKHHSGRWGTFKNHIDARYSSLVNNFVSDNWERFPGVIVKCEIKGKVDSSYYGFRYDTFLSTHIRVIEEVETLTYPYL